MKFPKESKDTIQPVTLGAEVQHINKQSINKKQTDKQALHTTNCLTSKKISKNHNFFSVWLCQLHIVLCRISTQKYGRKHIEKKTPKKYRLQQQTRLTSC